MAPKRFMKLISVLRVRFSGRGAPSVAPCGVDRRSCLDGIGCPPGDRPSRLGRRTGCSANPAEMLVPPLLPNSLLRLPLPNPPTYPTTRL